MTAYLFLLATFAAAWAVVGFSAAVLFLKMRWNLVGGFCLVVFGWVPVVIGLAVCVVAVVTGTLPTDLFTIEGMLDHGVFAYDAVRQLGYCLGVVAGTLIGFYPRTNEDGKRERRARSWPLWKTLAFAPVPLALAWGLFWLADLRAKDRLLDLRQQYQEYLAHQEEAAPSRSHNASSIHESVYIAMMQDPEPFRLNEDFTPPPGWVSDSLLEMMRPDFEHLASVRDYCQRHATQYVQLHEIVQHNGQKHHRWHPMVQRLVAINALLKIVDGDPTEAEEDLRLLRQMGEQCLDEYQGSLLDYRAAQQHRRLIFHAMLLSNEPIPKSTFEEMTARDDDWRWKIARVLKRTIAHQVADNVDGWMKEPPSYRFSKFWQTRATRIIQQEHYPAAIERLERMLYDFFLDPERRFTKFEDSPFARLDPDTVLLEVELAVDIAANLAIQDEMVRSIAIAEQLQQETGQWPHVEQLEAHLAEHESVPDTPIGYATLHDRASGDLLIAVFYHLDHAWIGDHQAIYLGPHAASMLTKKSGLPARRYDAAMNWQFWFEAAGNDSEQDGSVPNDSDSTLAEEPINPADS